MYVDNQIVHNLMNQAHNNFAIFDGFAKAFSVLLKHDNIACSVSGGKDSDIMLDIITKLDPERKVRYIWFNTGLEYQATKRHLDYLEQKYGIKIERIPPVKSIPASCKEYGQPFLSKYVSGNIYSLQRNGFKWEDKPYEELIAEYPKCSSAIKWWCNKYRNVDRNFAYSIYDISYNKYLKEFLVAHPPWFKISKNCCTYAKKKVSKKFVKDNDIDLMIVGIRKAEGGIRSAQYKTCFSPSDKPDGCDYYRPLFWYTGDDEREYEEIFEVTHSDCYVVWGMVRTGCVGCPFNKNLFKDLEIIQTYEPQIYKAATTIFKDSYEYTRMYKEFVEEQKSKERR